MAQRAFLKNKFQQMAPDPEIRRMLDDYARAIVRIELDELEMWLAECIALSDFDRIDDIFIAEMPDGKSYVQSWFNKPEWIA